MLVFFALTSSGLPLAHQMKGAPTTARENTHTLSHEDYGKPGSTPRSWHLKGRHLSHEGPCDTQAGRAGFCMSNVLLLYT